MMARLWLLMFCIVLAIPLTDGGPTAYVACLVGCAGAACACYAAAGLVFGTVTAGVGAPAAALACNAAQGQCYAACHAMAFLPTP